MSRPGDQVIFETERLIVRPYTMDDVDHFLQLNGDEEVMRYIYVRRKHRGNQKNFCKRSLQPILKSRA
ncbi:MAG: GNAT family N-acetyltransferase [Bacteroidota bacterium]